jgi:hypothetical protein
MSDQDLEKKWKEMLQETFDKFIDENVGIPKRPGPPSCFGSGDDKEWCVLCNWKDSC